MPAIPTLIEQIRVKFTVLRWAWIGMVIVCGSCAQSDYTLNSVGVDTASDASDEMGLGEVAFNNYCGTMTDPGGWATYPERLLGSMWERPIGCRDGSQSNNCSFIPAYDDLDANLLDKDSSELDERIYYAWVQWDGSVDASTLFDLFSISGEASGLI